MSSLSGTENDSYRSDVLRVTHIKSDKESCWSRPSVPNPKPMPSFSPIKTGEVSVMRSLDGAVLGSTGLCPRQAPGRQCSHP